MKALANTTPDDHSQHLYALARSVEARLSDLMVVRDKSDALGAAMSYAALAPGKRLRPVMTLLAAAEYGGASDDLLDLACAVEMIHAASLIMDDLPAMDDADSRRGQPAAHKVYGEPLAMLASVALLSRAQQTVLDLQGVDARKRCEIAGILARASGADGLSRGQMFDLDASPASSPEPGEIAHLKTGVLFIAAVEVAGARFSAAPADRERLRRFASHFGRAFQLADDLKDGSGPGQGEDRSRVTALHRLGSTGLQDELDRQIGAALGCLRDRSRFAALLAPLRPPVRRRAASGLRERADLAPAAAHD